MSSQSLGKLKNLETKKELTFLINPVDFQIDREYQYAVQSCLGNTTPVVSYEGANPTRLSFELIFDSDIDKDFDVADVEAFTRSLNQISSETKSVPQVSFSMGSFVFEGFVTSQQLRLVRFDKQGAPTSAHLALQLISAGAYEEIE